MNRCLINSLSREKGIFWQARTRILALYVALMTGFILLSIPIFTKLVFSQVNERVHRDLLEELQAFNTFQAKEYPDLDLISPDELSQLFRKFLRAKIPEDDTFLITIINGKFYRSSPQARPDIFAEDSELMQLWYSLEQAREGEWIALDQDTERVVYLAQPIIAQGQVQGVFVAAHTAEGEIQEALEAVNIVIQVLLVVLILASISAWFVLGKVLNPLRNLAITASAISESDLSQRIPVTGTGEIAEIATRFNQMMDRLQKAFLSQQEFLKDASHELRTPITIIRGHLELMGNEAQEQQETLEIVFDELDRMNRIVHDLLLLAKVEHPDFLQLETIDLFLFTEELYTKVTALAPRHWQLQNQARGYFQGDRQRLTQAIVNLGENATQHTRESDEITLGSTVDDTHVYFWLEDTGSGIAKEDQERIFQRFARASHSRRLSEGAGLGLSIVMAIAQTLGGRVEVESELGKGAKFTLILPLNNKGKTISRKNYNYKTLV